VSSWGRESEAIERAGGCAEMPLREMQVEGSDLEVSMTEQYLNGAQVGSGFEQVCGETMSQGVRMDMPVIEAGPFSGIWQADHRTLVVTGWLDVCQRLPGKSHSFGLRRSPRQ